MGGVWDSQWENSVSLVRPNDVFQEKQEIFHFCYDNLRKLGIHVNIIRINQVADYINGANYILFVDEDEKRALVTLCKCIYNKDNCKKMITYLEFVKDNQNYAGVEYKFAENYLKYLDIQGVHILNLVDSNGSEYYRKLGKKIQCKYESIGKKTDIGEICPEFSKEFFDDLYTKEYANEIRNFKWGVETKSGCGMLKDCKSKYINVVDGERVTLGQPQDYQRTIYFFGPCNIFGIFVEDKNTLASLLQKKLNDTKYKIRVVNCGSIHYGGIGGGVELELARIISTQLRKGDIVVIYIRSTRYLGIKELDLINILEKKEIDEKWMTNGPYHCNHKINALYADAIYDILKPVMTEMVDKQGEPIEQNRDFIKTLYLDRYFGNFNPFMYKRVGAIVMNCNPFTYGHRYLIEQALSIVDFLIIFVVEEDKSMFKFQERFAMVCEGVADFEKKVKVVPSGQFLLSQTTFPEYFIKATDEDLIENIENDVKRFAKYIAPRLNIKYRFVGEEPEDTVTREYNNAMKRILPLSGIELVEIPRKKIGNRYISASWVRNSLEGNMMEELKKLVPKSTLWILFGILQ